MDIDRAYKEFTVYKKKTYRTREEHSISCKKGNFSVSAPTKKEAEREAKHYFVQYFSDGEYNT